MTLQLNGDFVMLRGYPRKREWVKEAESEIGGKLVDDKEIALMYMLDQELQRLRRAHGKYPDYLQIPGESDLFLPIPFEITFAGITQKSYHKPAWMKVKRNQNMRKASWK